MSLDTASLLRASLTRPALWMLVREIDSALHGCRSVIDVGCGNSSPLRFLSSVHRVGVDGYAPALEEARRQRTHDEYMLGDARQLATLFPSTRFDACVALDVIEHLPKEDGWRLLADLERLATRRVVIFTPNGFLPQHGTDGDLQEHLSGWCTEEMRQRGYRVVGMLGPKGLRGEYHAIRYRPRLAWTLISLLAHHAYTRRCPTKAAALLCIKDIVP